MVVDWAICKYLRVQSNLYQSVANDFCNFLLNHNDIFERLDQHITIIISKPIQVYSKN
jgi:hypothetical protein